MDHNIEHEAVYYCADLSYCVIFIEKSRGITIFIEKLNTGFTLQQLLSFTESLTNHDCSNRTDYYPSKKNNYSMTN